MTSPFVRTWRYLAALLGARIDDLAEPRIQVQMALEETKRRHQLLTEQAAAVLGNERELEIKVRRAQGEVERIRTATGRALLLADRASREGDARQADGYEDTASMFAVQLSGAESTAADLMEAREQAGLAASAARRAVERSAYLLQARIVEGTRLTTEIETAKMQERVAETLTTLDALAPSGSIPSLADIRSRVDKRVSLAAAKSELAGTGTGARMLEVERAELEEAGRLKLAEIRRSLGLPEHVVSPPDEKASQD